MADRKPTLPERIDAILCGKPMVYDNLAMRLWDGRSAAFTYSSNGGPPGCYMALSAGLRRGGFHITYGKSVATSIVNPRKIATPPTQDAG